MHSSNLSQMWPYSWTTIGPALDKRWIGLVAIGCKVMPINGDLAEIWEKDHTWSSTHFLVNQPPNTCPPDYSVCAKYGPKTTNVYTPFQFGSRWCDPAVTSRPGWLSGNQRSYSIYVIPWTVINVDHHSLIRNTVTTLTYTTFKKKKCIKHIFLSITCSYSLSNITREHMTLWQTKRDLLWTSWKSENFFFF